MDHTAIQLAILRAEMGAETFELIADLLQHAANWASAAARSGRWRARLLRKLRYMTWGGYRPAH